jgi:hypothetical protein
MARNTNASTVVVIGYVGSVSKPALILYIRLLLYAIIIADQYYCLEPVLSDLRLP